jgi:hypothetical protein
LQYGSFTEKGQPPESLKKPIVVPLIRGPKSKKIVFELELDCWSWGGQYLPCVNPRRSQGSL